MEANAMRSKIRIVTFTGRPGSGKSTIITNVLAARSDMRMFEGRSFTTRPKRVGDVQGEYQHLTESEFFTLRESGAFIWYRYKDGFWYGTKQKDIEFALQAPYVSVMTLFTDTLPILHKFAGAGLVKSFFVTAPFDKTLLRRIVKDRGAEDLARANERLKSSADWSPDMSELRGVPIITVENLDEEPAAKTATEFVLRKLEE